MWIESGYTWLLWGGGIPLLGAYVWFVVVALRESGRRGPAPYRRASRHRPDARRRLAADIVLMIFDPHLTYRGAADALFALLACCAPSTMTRPLERPLPKRCRP